MSTMHPLAPSMPDEELRERIQRLPRIPTASAGAVEICMFDARDDGLEGYATYDAGPHVKVLCSHEHAAPVAARLRKVDGVLEVQSLGVGPDASLEVGQ